MNWTKGMLLAVRCSFAFCFKIQKEMIPPSDSLGSPPIPFGPLWRELDWYFLFDSKLRFNFSLNDLVRLISKRVHWIPLVGLDLWGVNVCVEVELFLFSFFFFLLSFDDWLVSVLALNQIFHGLQRLPHEIGWFSVRFSRTVVAHSLCVSYFNSFTVTGALILYWFMTLGRDLWLTRFQGWMKVGIRNSSSRVLLLVNIFY